MTSTTALESHTKGAAAQRDDKLHRGRNVVLAFLMQGESIVRPGRRQLMSQVGDSCSTRRFLSSSCSFSAAVVMRHTGL